MTNASDEHMRTMKESLTASKEAVDAVIQQVASGRAANKRLVDAIQRLAEKTERPEVPTERLISVRDNELPVASKRLAWPLSPIEFDTPVARPSFLAITNALFQWSAERQCRFFVRIVDDTLAHEKAIYKVQLRTVGYHFYYYEPLGSAFGGHN